MFSSTVNNHYTVNWRDNLNDISDLDDDSDNELPLSSISDFGHLLNNYKIKRSDIRKCKTADCLTKQKIKQGNKSPHRSKGHYFVHPIQDYKKIKCRSKIYDTVDHQIEMDINQDYELPLSSIADFLHPIENNLKNKELQKCGTVDYQTEQNNNQDNKSPHRSKGHYFVHPIHDYKKIKCRSKIYDTVDHQIELDINQDYELPLSSIADFLHPIENNLKTKELQKCGTVDYQTEQNNNQDDKLTISSIAHNLHSFNKNNIKHETVNCQSKENIHHYNKSEPNRLICNKEQSTIINNTLRKYECDICGKIFPKRTDIIKHFKTSLCYPEIIYKF